MRLLPLIILIALTSCGKIKKFTSTYKDKVNVEVEQEVAEEITVKEKVDTLIILPADTSTWNLPLRDLIDSTGLKIESETQIIEFKFNPKDNTVTTKATVKEKKVSVVINKETEIKRNTSTQSQSKVKTYVKDKKVEETKPLVPPVVWFALLIALLVYLAARFILR